jgi:hypothetical protein
MSEAGAVETKPDKRLAQNAAAKRRFQTSANIVKLHIVCFLCETEDGMAGEECGIAREIAAG